MTDKISTFRRVNEPRAARMLETLQMIEKSANSARIDQDEVRMMLTPVFSALGKHKTLQAPMPPIPTPVQPKGTYAAGSNAPRWAHMKDMIEDLSKQELVDALGFIATKLDEEINA